MSYSFSLSVIYFRSDSLSPRWKDRNQKVYKVVRSFIYMYSHTHELDHRIYVFPFSRVIIDIDHKKSKDRYIILVNTPIYFVRLHTWDEEWSAT